MKKTIVSMLVAATATIGSSALASPAGAAGCSAEMKSITPNFSIYEPGSEFGLEVAVFGRLHLVDDYVFFTMDGCGR